MAQNVSILPQCLQPAATQDIAAVGCQQSLACACNSLKFLGLLEKSILALCDLTDQALAFSSTRQYCTKVDPGLASNRNTVVKTTTIIFTILAIVSVILRFWSRRLTNARLGWDDFFVVAALLCSLVVDGLVLEGTNLGETNHEFMVNPNGTVITQKTQLASLWTGAASRTVVRLSIIALYLRIFTILSKFRRTLVVSGVIVVVLDLFLALLFTFQCRPVAYFWNNKIQGGHCLNQAQVPAALCGVDTATGLWVLILPMPAVRRLQTTLKRKMVLIGLFSIGGFACITALIRIPFVLEIDDTDLDYSVVPFTIWTTIENNMGIISVSLPTMAPLFQGWLPRLLSIMRSKSSPKSHSRLPEDEARIYTSRKSMNGNETRVTAARPEEGAKQKGPEKEEYEMWPISAIGVTKEVHVEIDGSLSSKPWVDQV